MKQGWEIKKLGDICTIKGRIGFRGYTRNDLVEEGEGAITLSPSNIVNDVINFDKCQYISWYKYDESPEIQIFEGDVIYAKTASIGKVAIIKHLPEKATINPQFVVFKDIKCNHDFLYYAVRGNGFKEQVSLIINGVAIPTISQSNMAKLTIPVPPIAEQERIVAELDCLSGIIEKKKQQLKELDNLAQSIFYEMFGEHADGRDKWKIAKLGNVCKTTSGGTPSKGHPEYYEGGDIPWLRSGEVNKMNIHETELFITEEGLNNSSAKWFPKGTVVIAMYGATVGQVGILCNPMTTNQAICGIFPNETFTPIYLYHFLLSKKPEYLEIATGGAQANISQNIVRDTVVSCPPLTLQQDFASKIESIEKQKELIAQSIKETETLFNSRMDYYFN